MIRLLLFSVFGLFNLGYSQTTDGNFTMIDRTEVPSSYLMKSVLLILVCFWLTSCNTSGNVTDNPDSAVVLNATTQAVTETTSARTSVIVLPPFDEIANEGISPDLQKYLETEIAKDTSLTLIKFPYKKLMNVPFYNVFDKKYCKPITEKVDTDIIIMTKLDQKERSGQMITDKWDLSIRIYNTRTDNQQNSKIIGNNLSDAEIASLLERERQVLVSEIKDSR